MKEKSTNASGKKSVISKISKKDWIKSGATATWIWLANLALLNPEFWILSENWHLSNLNEHLFWIKWPIAASTWAITFSVANRLKQITEDIDPTSVSAIKERYHEAIKWIVLTTFFAYSPDALWFDKEISWFWNQIIEAAIFKIKCSFYALWIPYNIFDTAILKHYDIDNKWKHSCLALFWEKYTRQIQYTLSFPPFLWNTIKEKIIDACLLKSWIRNTILFAISPIYLIPFITSLSDTWFAFYHSTNLINKKEDKNCEQDGDKNLWIISYLKNRFWKNTNLA